MILGAVTVLGIGFTLLISVAILGFLLNED
jgi:hypothetical protein